MSTMLLYGYRVNVRYSLGIVHCQVETLNMMQMNRQGQIVINSF